MNQLVKQNYVGQDLAIAERTGGMSIAPRNVADVIEFGHLMSTSGHAVPKHLRGNPGACMAVAMQAFEWEMSPFAVARKTYLVNDNIAYEAQLIAAVINTRAGLKQRLAIEWHGEGDELFCTVKGEFRDGSKHTYTSPPVGKITTKNSPLWKSDPRQQIAYFSVRSWGRLYAPEVILGIYDRDEMEHIGPDRAKDITPINDPFSDAPPINEEPSQTREGFDQSFVARETAALTGEADSSQTEDNSQSSESSPDDGSSGGDTPSSQTAAATNSPSDDESGTSEEGNNPGQVTTEQTEPSSDPVKRLLCEELVDNMIRDAFSEPAIERPAKLDKLRDAFLLPENLGDEPDFIRLCHETARRIIGNPAERERAREFLTGKIPVAKGGA